MKNVLMILDVRSGLCVLMAILFYAGGCASAPEAVKKRLFFPPAPAEPKIEWKGTYVDQHSFPKSARTRQMESIIGKAPSVGFSRPLDIASNGEGLAYVVDPESRNVFLYDMVNYKIRVLDQEGEGIFNMPVGIALDGEGRVYVTDRFKKEVLVFSPDGKPLFSFGRQDGVLGAPVGIAVDRNSGRVYVTDVKNQTVNVFDKKGELLSVWGKDVDGLSFNFPLDVDVLTDGTVAVADTMNARVVLISPSGEELLSFGKRGDAIDSFDLIKGIAVDTENHIYVADTGSNSIKIYDREGKLLLVFGGTRHGTSGVAPGGFGMMAGISIDKNNGIFVADQLNVVYQVFQYLDEEYLKLNPIPENYRKSDDKE